MNRLQLRYAVPNRVDWLRYQLDRLLRRPLCDDPHPRYPDWRCDLPAGHTSLMHQRRKGMKPPSRYRRRVRKFLRSVRARGGQG